MSVALVVVAGGRLGNRIARLGDDHAAFDPANRRVLRPGDDGYPSRDVVNQWGGVAAAVMMSADQKAIVFLDTRQAISEAWIEDAFVRAPRLERELRDDCGSVAERLVG